MATKLEKKGRKGDKMIAHLTPGEIVIPRALAEDDDFRGVIAHFMRENGAVPEQFIVGSGKNKINPETGYMEFSWLSSAVKSVTKTFKKVIGTFTKAFGQPDTPKAPALPDPTPAPAVGEGIAEESVRKSAARLGRAGTILTGNLRPVSKKKKFLG